MTVFGIIAIMFILSAIIWLVQKYVPMPGRVLIQMGVVLIMIYLLFRLVVLIDGGSVLLR